MGILYIATTNVYLGVNFTIPWNALVILALGAMMTDSNVLILLLEHDAKGDTYLGEIPPTNDDKPALVMLPSPTLIIARESKSDTLRL